MNTSFANQKLKTHQAVLQAIRAAIAQEQHVLKRHPQALWQQLYNRLQWEPALEQILAPQHEQRLDSRNKPWFEVNTQRQESHAFVKFLAAQPVFVNHLEISPDGKKLIVSGANRFVRIWDLAKSELMHTLGGFETIVNCSAFSPDGRFAAAGAGKFRRKNLYYKAGVYGDKLCVWDTNSGNLVHTFPGEGEAIRQCLFSTDSSHIAGVGKRIRVWNLENGVEVDIEDLKKNRHAFRSISFSDDGEKILSISNNNQHLSLTFDISHGKAMEKVIIHTRYFSPNGEIYAQRTGKNTVALHNARSGELARELTGHEGSVTHIQFSPDGLLLLTASADHTLKLWDPDSGEELSTLRGHTSKAYTCAFSPDGSRIYSGGGDGTIRIWDIQRALESSETKYTNLNAVSAFAFSHDGKNQVIANKDKSITIHDVMNTKEIVVLKKHVFEEFDPYIHKRKKVEDKRGGFVQSIYFSPCDKFIAAHSKIGMGYGKDSTVRIWDAPTGTALHYIRGCKSFHYSLDGNLAAKDNQILDAREGNVVFKSNDEKDHIFFNPNGRQVYSASASKLTILEVNTFKEIGAVEIPEFKYSGYVFDFSPDGRWMAVVDKRVQSSKKQGIRLLNTSTWKEYYYIEQVREDQQSFISAIFFSPDGSRLLTVVDRDHSIMVWDSTNGNLLKKMNGQSISGTKKGYSADGKYLLTVGTDHAVTLWDTGTWLPAARLFLQSRIKSLDLHPAQPNILLKEEDDTLYEIVLHGIEFGPAVVLPLQDEISLFTRCPRCGHEQKVTEQQFDHTITCGSKACKTTLMLKSPIEPQLISRKKTLPQFKLSPDPQKPGKNSEPGSIGLSKEKERDMRTYRKFRTAAENGQPRAQMVLGTIYERGNDFIIPDIAQAVEWYRKSAEGGDADGQVHLGDCFANGKGIEKDLFKAAKLFRKAALSDNAQGQFRLAECYAKGLGVPQDIEQAKIWYRKAAAQNHAIARVRLKIIERKQGTTSSRRRPASTRRATPSPSTRKSGRTISPASQSNDVILLGQEAAVLKAKGDFKGALTLYKEQEKILKEKNDLQALKINLLQQNIVAQKLLNQLDQQIAEKLKNRGKEKK